MVDIITYLIERVQRQQHKMLCKCLVRGVFVVDAEFTPAAICILSDLQAPLQLIT